MFYFAVLKYEKYRNSVFDTGFSLIFEVCVCLGYFFSGITLRTGGLISSSDTTNSDVAVMVLIKDLQWLYIITFVIT